MNEAPKSLLFKTKNTEKCEWKHTYTVLKQRVKQVHMSQRYNDNTKRPKLQDTQLGILKIYAFRRKIQQRLSGPGKSTTGVTVYENTPEKLPHLPPKKFLQIYLVVQGRAQLEHNSHIVKVGVKATC